jgi:uncharacterized MAPEG superfamily protein
MSQPVLAYWCLFIAGVMPYSVLVIAKGSRDYDNEDPRNMDGFRTPIRRRAHAAHQNSFEAFAFFAAAILVAALRGVPPRTIDDLAVLWMVLRMIYIAVYLAGRGTLRSLVWVAAIATTIAIFLSALL